MKNQKGLIFVYIREYGCGDAMNRPECGGHEKLTESYEKEKRGSDFLVEETQKNITCFSSKSRRAANMSTWYHFH